VIKTDEYKPSQKTVETQKSTAWNKLEQTNV